MRDLAARFWSKVDRRSDSECWPFTGAQDSHGYGSFKRSTRCTAHAHRLAWELTRGPIPASAVIRHACDTPLCVNPGHLVVGTHADNVADRVARGRSALGERNGRSKLTSADVVVIRGSRIANGLLALVYGVTHWTIKDIRKGKTWRHLVSAPRQGQLALHE